MVEYKCSRFFGSKDFYVHFHSSERAGLKDKTNIIQPGPFDLGSWTVFQMWEIATERWSGSYKYPDFNPSELVVFLPKITRKLTIDTSWYRDLLVLGEVFSLCSEIQAAAHKVWQSVPENRTPGSVITFDVQVHNCTRLQIEWNHGRGYGR